MKRKETPYDTQSDSLFQTVARHQHFRLAAAELSISQPSLSRSIAVLEEELGIILFERKGRTVTLTKYGKLF